MFTAIRQLAHYAGPLIKSVRVHQWVKNTFVLAPLLFSKHLFTQPKELVEALAGTLLFCMASGAVYLVNDILDLEADRAHPTKRHRPLAAGNLPIGVAIRATTSLVGCSLLFAFMLEYRFAIVLASYLLLNLFYSRYLKHVAFLDVATIAAGFLLRVLAGGTIIDVTVSRWLLLCTFLLATFLGLGKRRHELAATRDAPEGRRKVLSLYHPRLLLFAMLGAGALTISAYSAYTLDAGTQRFFGTDLLPWTIPMIVMGILRFLQLVSKPGAESPTEAMLRDMPFMLNVGLWVGMITWLLAQSVAGV